MIEQSGLYYPNRIARWLLIAMEDVMGTAGLNAILTLAGLGTYIDQPPPNTMARQFDFAHLSSMAQALEEMYGARGGRGIALRIGRACFSQGLKNFGAMAGMTDPAFQILPLDQRTRLGLDAVAAIFVNFSDQVTTVEESAAYYDVIVDPSPMAWGRSTDKPVCHALTGILQETMRWASDGHEFSVQETTCRAAGHDVCTFRVSKSPIGHS